MNNAGALQYLLHDAGGLIPSSARCRGRDDAEMLIGGLRFNGRRSSADDQRDPEDGRNDAPGPVQGATHVKFTVSSMLPVPL